MRFTFLHAADLHLNSPFLGLATKDDSVAAAFAKSTREAFSNLITKAIECKVAFAVIAGDVYDGEWKDTSIGLFFNREIARLERESIPVFLVKGNHDAESVVTRALQPPANVRVFPSSRPGTFQLEEWKVALHGRSFPNRAVTENYAVTYPAPVPGWFNIGVLHTSCDGRPNHAAYAPCSVQDLALRGYDYWALGHVHDYEELSRDPWIVFPGNLQGRNIREQGPKGAVLVTVADGRVEEVSRLIVDRARWLSVEVDAGEADNELALVERIQQAIARVASGCDQRLVALRLTIVGSTHLNSHLRANLRRMSDEAQAAAQRVHEDIWLERLVISTSGPPTMPVFGAATALDLRAILETLGNSPEIHQEVRALLATIGAKMPGGAAELEVTLDQLVLEAAATILDRTGATDGEAARCA